MFRRKVGNAGNFEIQTSQTFEMINKMRPLGSGKVKNKGKIVFD